MDKIDAGAGLPVRRLGEVRTDWMLEEVERLFDLPFNDLLYAAHTVHRRHFDPNAVQMSTLLSIKTGGCPEDCAYCPQSVHYRTGVEAEPLMALEDVLEKARLAQAQGATRFCMGAAYRNPKPSQIGRIAEMIRGVRALGLETCATLGMLTAGQARELADAGLDYYNHNLDTSREHYERIIHTRGYDDRLETLRNVRAAGMKVCCGGIVGMGESRRDRAALLHTLATLPAHPESLPINRLVRVPGTPLEDAEEIDALEFIRTIAVARIVCPKAHVRLSAGRSEMSDTMQALAYFAGANSIFYGEKLLTTGNPDEARDRELLGRLGIGPEPAPAGTGCPAAAETAPRRAGGTVA
jgi:biotin synthase